jgi:hypothetical protein
MVRTYCPFIYQEGCHLGEPKGVKTTRNYNNHIVRPVIPNTMFVGTTTGMPVMDPITGIERVTVFVQTSSNTLGLKRIQQRWTKSVQQNSRHVDIIVNIHEGQYVFVPEIHRG